MNSKKEIASAFGTETDPLKKFEEKFRGMEVDIYDLYLEEIVEPKSISDSRRKTIERTIDQYKQFMEQKNRHYAVPSTDLVMSFAYYCYEERGNGKESTEDKLRILRSAYNYFQRESAYPHPTDYDPFNAALAKLSFDSEEPTKPPMLSTDELRKQITNCTDIRGRAFIVLQLKLGLRASELCNIRLDEIHISNAAIEDHYNQLGGSIDEENAVFIPSNRKRNKSQRDRMLPLDEECRKVLTEWLLIRPSSDSNYLFLSKKDHTKLSYETVTKEWKDTFHPAYDGSGEHRSITSHYGRHYFTTYFTVKKDWNRELIKYMRGDRFADSRNTSSMDAYVHNYYSDIESRYRSEIFKLNI